MRSVEMPPQRRLRVGEATMGQGVGCAGYGDVRRDRRRGEGYGRERLMLKEAVVVIVNVAGLPAIAHIVQRKGDRSIL
jgi:hypothetical protein